MRRIELNGKPGIVSGVINGKPFVRLDGEAYSRVVHPGDLLTESVAPVARRNPPAPVSRVPRRPLARCPYCGAPAEVRSRADTDGHGRRTTRYLIGCFAASCPVAPRDTGVHLEAARARWNRGRRAR